MTLILFLVKLNNLVIDFVLLFECLLLASISLVCTIWFILHKVSQHLAVFRNENVRKWELKVFVLSDKNISISRWRSLFTTLSYFPLTECNLVVTIFSFTTLFLRDNYAVLTGDGQILNVFKEFSEKVSCVLRLQKRGVFSVKKDLCFYFSRVYLRLFCVVLRM